ncbi:MAG: type II toxin-antitoxin system HicB family antitoxin [Candidatus Symbiothrix sp.]|jgi:predicted RNase H-like HicB family nuclease|nr:type II toxin-antitoxin system HicB family antitoxin [Candidatus Symbiothrix sp.]
MSEIKKIKVILEKGKDGYGVMYEDIDTVFGFGETVELAKEDAYIALNNYIDYLKETQRPIPEILQGQWELEFSFDVQAMLNYFSNVFTSTALSGITGINASLIRQYAMGIKKPRKRQVEKMETGLNSLGKELETLKLAL